MPIMDGSKFPTRPPAARFFSFPAKNPSSAHKPQSRSLWLSIASSVVFVVLVYLAAASRSAPPPLRFGIIIDAGSSGTRIHVFGSKGESGAIPSLVPGSMAVMRVTPGLSSFSGEPERAGASLEELLEFAKGKVAKDRWRDTEVRLLATAGLRMVDMAPRERILESCRRVLRLSGFRFKNEWATVIPGSDEGTYAWVAANYALGSLGGDPEKTTGIMELGGASAQVTFVSSETLPPEFSRVLTFGKTTYNLYSNSFLHFGQNAAHESLRKLLNSRDIKTSDVSRQEGTLVNPCSPKGYSHGGNFSECRSTALSLLQKEKDNCLYQLCHLGSTFIPKMRGNFIATENFFYTSKFFGLSPTSSLSEMMHAGEEYCEQDWSKTKKKYHSADEEDLSRYCFSAAYIVALLHDSFGIPLDDKRIEYTNQVGDVEIEWALGAYIVQSMTKSSENADWVTAMIHGDLVLMLLVASALLVLTAWLVSKWRRPRMKTIYDLEKGHYIITRAS
ncbi:GDA1 CD39 family protein [Musa troglodytarum]|uniref:GDA1 CD39 family protein n=1 Tax=Musa troglodytarum TaxID=320322 RepID=A0A9E7FTR4_9LILI|nr:GDA1 CD39 family protein [Musa troglodytarum]